MDQKTVLAQVVSYCVFDKSENILQDRLQCPILLKIFVNFTIR